MTERHWLLEATLLAVHDMQLAEHGGPSGVRDQGLLQSALARPQQLQHYGNPGIFELAAAYTVGIVKNHPFADGNKRAGFIAGLLFLELNGYTVNASETAAANAILSVAAGLMDEIGLAKFLEENANYK
jgi:death on curing protein